MITSIHLQVRPVWDEAAYVGAVVYQDDPAGDPVTLSTSGRVALHGADRPHEILRAVVLELERQVDAAAARAAGAGLVSPAAT